MPVPGGRRKGCPWYQCAPPGDTVERHRRSSAPPPSGQCRQRPNFSLAGPRNIGASFPMADYAIALSVPRA